MARKKQNPYLLAGISAIIVIVLFLASAKDVLLATINGALTAALFFHLALKSSAQTRALTAAAVIAAILYIDHFKWLTVLFLASLFLGLYYSRLARTLQREDDFLYIPLFYALFFFSIFLVLSYFIHRQNPIAEMRGFLNKSWEEISGYLEQVGAFSGLASSERGELESRLRSRLFFYFTGASLALYQVLVFFLCRFLRKREAEQLGKTTPPFAFLRIRESYLFVLIIGIVAEILGKYKDEQSLLYLSRTIFVLSGATYFLAGLSLVAFLFLLRRYTQGKRRMLTLLPFVALLLFVLYPRICAIAGLLDVWFDFRRKLSIPAQ